MKHLNCNGMSNKRRVSRLFGFAIVMALTSIGFGFIGVQASDLTVPEKQENPPIVTECKADLEKRLELKAQDIKVSKVQATTWPDASLGMPEVGKVYAQVLTPGFLIVLEAKSSKYLYTAGTKTFKYGGPIGIWSCSMLYLKPVMNEPNLNSDLYQSSLMGTNSVRLISGVTDYYPQEKGVVIFTRRTSRSGHDLFYIKVGEAEKPRILHSSFAFGDSAINSEGDKWAAFVKPMVGAAWNINIGSIDQKNEDIQTLPLPDGVMSGQIAWSGENLMILVKKGEWLQGYEISPKAEKPEWKGVSAHTFPGLPDYMLNKSESLDISQVTDDGKPAVEVASVWFTGDRNVIARISGLTLQGSDLFAGRFAFIWGKMGEKPAAYSVDIVTGEVIPGLIGTGQNIKLFRYMPLEKPIVPELFE